MVKNKKNKKNKKQKDECRVSQGVPHKIRTEGSPLEGQIKCFSLSWKSIH